MFATNFDDFIASNRYMEILEGDMTLKRCKVSIEAIQTHLKMAE